MVFVKNHWTILEILLVKWPETLGQPIKNPPNIWHPAKATRLAVVSSDQSCVLLRWGYATADAPPQSPVFCGFFWGAPEKSTWKKLDFEGNLWLLKFNEFRCFFVKVLVRLYWLVYLYSFGVFFVSRFCGVFWIHPIPKSRPEYILSESSPNLKSNIMFSINSLTKTLHTSNTWSCWNSIQGECHHHSPHGWCA